MIYRMLKNMKTLLKDMQDADKVVRYLWDGIKDTKLRGSTSLELYEKIQSPITTKLEKLENENVTIPFMYDRMLNQNQLAIEDPYYYQPQAIEEPESDGFKKSPKQKTLQLIFLKILISKY